jgi:hypothetical protein
MEPWRIYRSVVADSPPITLMRSRIQIRIEVNNWIRIRIKVTSWIRIHIKVMRICNPRLLINGQCCGSGSCAFFTRVSDPDPYPDPYWIRIQSDHRIRNLNTDPDPGGQK